MKIEKDKFVAMDYVLKNDEGNILDSSQGHESFSYIHGSGSIIPGLENSLEGQTAGNELSVTVKPEDAYGEYREELNEEIPLEDLQGIENLQVGMQLQGQGPHGVHIYTVAKINDDSVVMDGNHPLAGKNLHFEVKINEVRDATEEELAALNHSCCGGNHDADHECQHGECNC